MRLTHLSSGCTAERHSPRASRIQDLPLFLCLCWRGQDRLTLVCTLHFARVNAHVSTRDDSKAKLWKEYSSQSGFSLGRFLTRQASMQNWTEGAHPLPGPDEKKPKHGAQESPDN
jgi:hypothetical protein